MTSIAFIGLGIMGTPMARNLLAVGHELTVFNRSRERIERLMEEGARGATSVARAVGDAEFVITMLPDSPDVESVVDGPDGAFAHMHPGSTLIDMSTILPEVSRRLGLEGARRGIGVLDAPVSGGEAGAIEGTLSIMVGGDADTFAASSPILEPMGSTIVHVGPSGSGQTVKAANQLIVAGALQFLAEALVFLDASDVDLNRAVDVLSGGLAGSTVLTRKAQAMLGHDFTPGFRVALHDKDMSIALDAIGRAGTAAPLATAVAGLMRSLRAQGAGDLDHSALLLQVEELSGRGAQLTGTA